MLDEIRKEIAKAAAEENITFDSDVMEDLFLHVEALVGEGADDGSIARWALDHFPSLGVGYGTPEYNAEELFYDATLTVASDRM